MGGDGKNGKELELERAKTLNLILEKGLPLLDKYYTSKLEKIEAPKFKLTLFVFGFLLLITLLTTGTLVYFDKVSSDNFTFVLGILIGSAVTLVGNIILGVQE